MPTAGKLPFGLDSERKVIPPSELHPVDADVAQSCSYAIVGGCFGCSRPMRDLLSRNPGDFDRLKASSGESGKGKPASADDGGGADSLRRSLRAITASVVTMHSSEDRGIDIGSAAFAMRMPQGRASKVPSLFTPESVRVAAAPAAAEGGESGGNSLIAELRATSAKARDDRGIDLGAPAFAGRTSGAQSSVSRISREL